MAADKADGRRSGLGLTLQLLLIIILPLTVLLIAVAIASIAIHEQAMRASLPQSAWSAATNPALDLTLVAPLVLIAPILFAFGALWFAARQIVQPLQKLESRASAVASGDFDAIDQPVGGISEVRHLQRELSDMARKVQASQEGLHNYIGAITSAQEEERLRVARELHDDTIQELIALRQRLQLAKPSVNDAAAVKLISELEDLAEGTIEDVRRLTRALRPIYLEDLGLVTALEMLARETSPAAGLQVEFRRNGQEQRLPQESELALYRIAQQALNNVVHHARARRATLEITFDEKTIRLEISDDGRGFEVPANPTDLAPSGHFGLLGMRERADLIGASLEITSKPGRGTRISVRLPATRSQPP